MRHLIVRLIGCLTVACLTVGCATMQEPSPGDAEFAPTYPPMQPAPPAANGAIYNPATALNLYTDVRARRVGDIITVKLDEKTRAQKNQDTEIAKASKGGMESPNLLGSALQFNAPGILPLASNQANSLSFGYDSSTDFSGEADSSQSNLLQGEITVTVSEVLPNGNLIIRGEKWLTLNQGDEYIRISGIIRPEDVEPDNSISSGRVANAQISYSGKGSLNEANRNGWLSAMFGHSLWPF